MTGHNRRERVIPLSDKARQILADAERVEMLNALQRARADRRLDRIGANFTRPAPLRLVQREGGAHVVAGRATLIPAPAVRVSRPWWRRLIDRLIF